MTRSAAALAACWCCHSWWGGAGLGAVAFRWLIVTATRLLSGQADYTSAPGGPHPLLPGLGRWFVVLAPVVAGLLYGPLVQRFAREARGHGVPEVMYAVARRGGRIRARVAVVKALASAVCIGGGGSVGREGPIVQIGSALGSTVGRWVRLPESRLSLLVAAGAAGGISATFNTPVAGVFFAMELILGDFAVESFGAVVLASVTAGAIGRAILGDHPFLSLPTFRVDSPVEYLLYALLGLLGALVGVGFSRILYLVEDLCDRLWRGPEWLRPAAGGVLLGGLLLVLPQMYGVGYPVLGAAVAGRYAVVFLLVLLLGKMLATSLTIGIGGSGGVFAPSLFIGAMLGAAFGAAAHTLLPQFTGPAGAYALVGMGAVFAGAARVPITAVVIMFELTGEYSIVLPLMVAIALAAGLSRLISADTIYTRKLRRRGIDLDRAAPGPLDRATVATAMGPLPVPVDSATALPELAARLAGGASALPVVDPAGELRGVVLAREIEAALRDGADDVTAASLARTVPAVHPDDTLDEALARMIRHGSALPVADRGTGGIVGWLTHRQILNAVTVPNQRSGPTAAAPPRPAVIDEPARG
ncbi:chloride channel protein [Plantactinospora sp. KBS50]|uniref:chloride channel protein n=1 Tax=Plantactinospora sp. KBS50 TaxID=2024580 RepID=UPI0018E0181B|nr:chloride channel protein [Plantactinospora sp. KBS50]